MSISSIPDLSRPIWVTGVLLSIIVSTTALTALTPRQEAIGVKHESALPPATIERFERIVQRLMRDLKTPGLSAIILKDQEVVWEKGFGYADLEREIEATPDTPYGLASVTKALASVVFFRSLERGFLSLDDPAGKYDAFMSILDNAADIKLRHLLSHTSLDPVGTIFSYDGNRYGGTSNAIKRASGRSFREQFQTDIAGPLGMRRTVANPIDPELQDRFRAYLTSQGTTLRILDENSKPYPLVNGFEYTTHGWGLTYQLFETMIRKAMDTTTYGSGLFESRQEFPVDDETQKAFNQFWLNEPEQDTYRELAKPYHCDERVNITRSDYPTFFNPGAGMISTARDLAKFDIALDRNQLISPETKVLAWEPVRSPSGDVFPYGYGWFTQEYGGRKIVWHGGAWRGMSSLYLKVPDEDFTFIMLSNSKVQSDAFDMGAGDALKSGFGLAFLRLFLYEPMFGETGPDIDWLSPAEDIVRQIESVRDKRLRDLYLHEIQVMQGMYMFMRRTDVLGCLFNGVVAHFSEPFEDPYADWPVIAHLTDVGDNQRKSLDFTLDQATNVRIYAIGEISPDGAYDYGWIVKRGTGEMVWSMDQSEWDHAGGASRNRLADIVLQLPAGAYTLHYITDDSHAYMSWNSTPPDHLFWGIRVLKERN